MPQNLKAKHKRRRKREVMNLALLLFVLLSLLMCYILLRGQEIVMTGQDSILRTWFPSFFKDNATTENSKAKYRSGDQVMLKNLSDVSSQLENQYNKIGTIEKVEKKSSEQKEYFEYTVRFSEETLIDNISEDQLKTATSKYKVGDSIELSPTTGLNGSGKITSVSVKETESSSQIFYNATIDGIGQVVDITDSEISTIYDVPLKTDNSPEENLKVLSDATSAASKNNYTILNFPSGDYKIGTSDPSKNYVILSSNTEFRGNGVNLVVDGTMYWFGLATGSQATDGLTNFTMHDMNIKANDLVNGDHFMVMANHGNNWSVYNNTFTLVHKSGSHIFDLGGVQNATFETNQFIGYAPDITSVTSLPEDEDLHKYYAEVIQYDASDNTGVWDANLIKSIDPDYATHNSEKQVSSNITVTNNKFLPYIDASGKIVAYSGTIGQHSSQVGYATVTNNTFESPFVTRFSQSEDLWYFKPIHFPADTVSYISGNTISS